MVRFVPLQISNSDAVVWTNETPNSVTLCRTVMFEFTIETESLCLKVYKKYNKIIKNESFVLSSKTSNLNCRLN